jgi:aminopeptidase
LYDLSAEYPIVSVVGLGPVDAGFNELEEIDEKRENIRAAVAYGARSLRDLGADITEILVDDCQDGEAAAEGGHLALFVYDELKSDNLKKPKVNLTLLNQDAAAQWQRGSVLAQGQNLARRLMETPANKMTPTIFAGIAKELAEPLGVEVKALKRPEIEALKMGSFLSVANGSEEPPIFLELKYNNAPGTKPLALVGKGITFDSGGISLKPSSNMDKMRADMGGAANVLSAIVTLATLKAPVNVVGLAALTENLPSGKATKPGDVVIAMNGKSIQVDNTDAEGRLVLADALHYAHRFDPQAIVDLATLTGAMNVALGSGATGVFSTSARYWNLLHDAGVLTGDRVWRFPLFNHYTKQTTDSQLADLQNIGKHAGQGGACIAAAFLREFVTHPNWLHLDIAGTMENKDEVAYLGKGMAGRPLRTLVKFTETVFEKK